MHSVAYILALIGVVAWLYLLFAHGGFWRVSQLRAAVPPTRAVDGIIAVVIPARDEAPVIGATVQSLLLQSGSSDIQVILVDDHSSDDTAEAARSAAEACGRPQALEVIAAQNLPVGWTGKLWALQQGIARATELAPKYLLLTDADIKHSSENVATLVAIAEAGSYDLASFAVKLHCSSFAEKLLIPAFVFFFFMLYPPRWIRDSRRRTAGAAGGCMLVNPAALENAGGIAAIRGQIIDDCALARAIKRSGGRIWLGITPDTHSMRAYGSFAEIERMIARTAFNQLQHLAILLLGTILGLALIYVAPAALLLSGDSALALMGALGWLLMTIAYLPMIRFYGLGRLWALSLPFSAVFYMFATVHSAAKYWSGRGGEWKGRTQDHLHAEASTTTKGQR